MSTVTAAYLMGIKEGRECLEKHGTENFTVQDRIDNLRRTIKGFAANNEVGQMLRGELDFWKNQAKLVDQITGFLFKPKKPKQEAAAS